MPTKIEKDDVTGRDTTGHEWDGIRELNTPLPRWWVNLFYVTVIWAFGYMAVYPSLPWIGGWSGYWSRAELSRSLEEQRGQRGAQRVAHGVGERGRGGGERPRTG